MESVGANLCEGSRAVVVSSGYFGERWEKIAALHGAEVEAIRYEWGETPRADEVAARLAELGGADVVFLTQSETSTGVVADVQALAAAAKQAGALVAVDAISSLGAVPLEMDAWGLDAVASGSQKALMTPPGLALCAGLGARRSPRRSRRGASTSTGTATRKAQAKLDAPFTPATSLIVALDVALGLLLDGRARGGVRAPRAARPRLPRAARRRWGSSCSRRTTTAAPSSRRSASPEAIDSGDVVSGVRKHFGMTHRERPGPSEGEDLPPRPHRLVRHLRHHDGARRRRARPRGAGRRRRARRRRDRGARGVRAPVGRVTAKVLVRESISDAGVELLRSRFDVDVDADSDARGDHRPLRRASSSARRRSSPPS